MRKVMPGCFLGWNRVGCLVGAAGFNGGVGYGEKFHGRLAGKGSVEKFSEMLAKRSWGFLKVADWREKMVCSRRRIIWNGRNGTRLGPDVKAGSCTVVTGHKIGSTRYEKGHARVLFGVE